MIHVWGPVTEPWKFASYKLIPSEVVGWLWLNYTVMPYRSGFLPLSKYTVPTHSIIRCCPGVLLGIIKWKIYFPCYSEKLYFWCYCLLMCFLYKGNGICILQIINKIWLQGTSYWWHSFSEIMHLVPSVRPSVHGFVCLFSPYWTVWPRTKGNYHQVWSEERLLPVQRICVSVIRRLMQIMSRMQSICFKY